MAPHHGPTWDFEGEMRKLLALGVPNNDTSDFEAIVATRHARKGEIVDRLELRRSDHVLDLGSGMGLIAEVIAPEVARVHCVDISDTFLADCRKRLGALDHVEFHKIGYADLSVLYSKQINKAYSTLLFIHFNFYDIFFYLQELNKVLKERGLLYFDYNDGERFSLAENSDSFHDHLALYKGNREHWIFGCMHMTSYGLLRNLAPQLGFRILNNWPSQHCYSQILLEKTHDIQR